LQVVGDHHRSTAEPGCVLCLRCHHLELTAGQQDARLASFQRVASQDPAPLHCGWEVRALGPAPGPAFPGHAASIGSGCGVRLMLHLDSIVCLLAPTSREGPQSCEMIIDEAVASWHVFAS
jgi:hypothetical protein